MIGPVLGLALLATTAAPESPAIVPLSKQTAAELKHPGDRRRYVVYPGSALDFRVAEPTAVEIAARAVLKKGTKNVRLHLVVRLDRQVVVDQSQVLAVDPRARLPRDRLSRPLVSFADVGTGPAQLSVEVRSKESNATAIYVAVSAIRTESTDAPLPDEVGTATVLPDLVAPQPPPSALPIAPPVARPQPAPVVAAPAAASQPAPSPYRPSRYFGFDLGALFNPGIPGAELAGRYYLPLLEERLSTGARAGYLFTGSSQTILATLPSSTIELYLHQMPLVAFAEAEALRLTTPAGRLTMGARVDAGALVYAGAVTVRTMLGDARLHENEKPLLGVTWCAGGAVTVGLEPGIGALLLDLGYLYAPDATASSGDDARYRVQQRVLGPRAALGYRVFF
ncbi:MAG: hypothetical protein JXR83_05975 [Deltaproteobacteria bacterium]|nr:hypothetical protein [Deltaproteobacteria bacterium]